MKIHGVMQMMKTVGTITPLGSNRFLVKWGTNSQTVIAVEENAQQSAHSAEQTAAEATRKFGEALDDADIGVKVLRR